MVGRGPPSVAVLRRLEEVVAAFQGPLDFMAERYIHRFQRLGCGGSRGKKKGKDLMLHRCSKLTHVFSNHQSDVGRIAPDNRIRISTGWPVGGIFSALGM